MPTVVLRRAFAAGFWGTAAAGTASSSFATGAAIGASAGFSGGFVSGTGNSLVEGQSLGSSLVNGIKTGGIGALTGGAIGGLAGGIDAALDGRRFFDGAAIDDITLVDQGNPYIPQNNRADCVAACGESATNGNVTQADIRNHLSKGSNADLVGLGDGDMVNYISSRDGGSALYGGNKINSYQLVDRMRKGNQIFANLQGGDRHLVVMNKVVERTITKISGDVITKNMYYAMDPLKGQYSRLSSGF